MKWLGKSHPDGDNLVGFQKIATALASGKHVNRLPEQLQTHQRLQESRPSETPRPSPRPQVGTQARPQPQARPQAQAPLSQAQSQIPMDSLGVYVISGIVLAGTFLMSGMSLPPMGGQQGRPSLPKSISIGGINLDI